MFKVKIYTKLYVFGVKKTVWISFFFFSSSSSPQGMFHGSSSAAVGKLHVHSSKRPHWFPFSHR